MNTLIKCLGALIAAFVLASCGGGGGSPGMPVTPVTPVTPVNPPSDGDDGGSTVTAADLLVSTDKASLSNSGSDSVVLTVTALDRANNTLPGVAVKVAVDNNAIYSPTTGSTTGADGTVSGKIMIGADKSNRLVRYTVTAGNLVKAGAVSVSGAVLSATAVPSAPTQGANVTLTVNVKDASGNGIPDTSVTMSGVPNTSLPAESTDRFGNATFEFPAPAAGTYPVVFEASGATGSYDLQVAGGAIPIPPAQGPISSVSAIANPVVVAANTSGSKANQAEVRVLFLTTGNNPLPRMRVLFSIVSTARLPGESLTAGSNLVYSDATGVAKTNYIAGTMGSARDGVRIKACYGADDAAARSCQQSIETSLTVTSNPVNLTIGTDNKVLKTSSGISYIKRFEIQAVNSAGQAVKDVQLSAILDIEGYWKAKSWAMPESRFDDDYYPKNVEEKLENLHKWCRNEDLNRNGAIDIIPGGGTEDINGDGFLTPRQSDVAIAFWDGSATSTTGKTDSNGLAQLQVTYSQEFAGWERVKITVTANVVGSEGAATYTYVLGPAEEDKENGSFLTPPYGSSNSCTDPN